MVVLRNIIKNEERISADYYPENEPVAGHIEVDLKTEEIVSLDKAKGYEFSTAPSHARMELLRIARSGKIPEERFVLWY